MIEKKVKLYKFSELSEEQKNKVIALETEFCYDANFSEFSIDFEKKELEKKLQGYGLIVKEIKNYFEDFEMLDSISITFDILCKSEVQTLLEKLLEKAGDSLERKGLARAYLLAYKYGIKIERTKGRNIAGQLEVSCENSLITTTAITDKLIDKYYKVLEKSLNNLLFKDLENYKKTIEDLHSVEELNRFITDRLLLTDEDIGERYYVKEPLMEII